MVDTPDRLRGGFDRYDGEHPKSGVLWWKASLLTNTRSYNMIVSDCTEGGKHEDRDCDRIGEEIQGDV